jgi:imidazoleglycerol phosphate synthase glutamine amidotransferase subunit HisH
VTTPVKRVAIAAYGAGNVRSVELALRRLGAEVELVHEPSPLLDADLAVLPGVGSARSAMAGLRDRGLDEALRERAAAGRSILGICLGLQLALQETEEDGGVAGLGLVPGRAVRLRDGRIPRIGWALVEPAAGPDPGQTQYGARNGLPTRPALPSRSVSAAYASGHTLVAGSGPGLTPGVEAFWFAHSYAVETPVVVATSEGITAVVESGSFLGVQFHPEKSGAAGSRFLERCLSRA